MKILAAFLSLGVLTGGWFLLKPSSVMNAPSEKEEMQASSDSVSREKNHAGFISQGILFKNRELGRHIPGGKGLPYSYGSGVQAQAGVLLNDSSQKFVRRSPTSASLLSATEARNETVSPSRSAAIKLEDGTSDSKAGVTNDNPGWFAAIKSLFKKPIDAIGAVTSSSSPAAVYGSRGPTSVEEMRSESIQVRNDGKVTNAPILSAISNSNENEAHQALAHLARTNLEGVQNYFYVYFNNDTQIGETQQSYEANLRSLVDAAQMSRDPVLNELARTETAKKKY